MHPARYFEDFTVGEVLTSQRKTMTESEIIDFAFKYDPQPFHISVPDAEQTMFGGIIASGFQTLAVTFRLVWQANGWQQTGTGGNGIENLRWLKPVRPGDTLRAEQEVLETRPSKSMPGIGIVKFRTTAYNQHDEPVLTMEAPNFILMRPKEGHRGQF